MSESERQLILKAVSHLDVAGHARSAGDEGSAGSALACCRRLLLGLAGLIDRGSAEEQERWLSELAAAEKAEDFPQGGQLILAESQAHAVLIGDELRGKGHRVLIRGVYVRAS